MITLIPGTPVDRIIMPEAIGLGRAIEDLVGERIVEVLTAYCKTSLESNPATQHLAATVVRQGAFQENPVKDRISIMVNPSDPIDLNEEPRRSDTISSLGHEGLHIPAYEVGGGEHHWLRFTVDFRVYLMRSQESRSDARATGLFVIARAEQAIRKNRGLGIKDDFGESALFMNVEKVNKYEGGGPPKSFSWEGQMWISVLSGTDEVFE
jgi:hypothetical protein